VTVPAGANNKGGEAGNRPRSASTWWSAPGSLARLQKYCATHYARSEAQGVHHGPALFAAGDGSSSESLRRGPWAHACVFCTLRNPGAIFHCDGPITSSSVFLVREVRELVGVL